MPHAENQGVHIHYEVEGEGPPLVLQHGLTSSVRDWYDCGYVEGLKNDYRLILVDARGHGCSDKPHDADVYTSKSMAGDIVAVLDKLNLKRAHYLGYSMGGWIGLAIAKHAPERFYSLIIGGMHHGKLGPDFPEVEPFSEGMEATVASWEEQSGPLDPDYRAKLLANDAEALRATLLGMFRNPGFEDVLPTITMPCLLYVGEADGEVDLAKDTARRIPDVTFVTLPELDHMEAFGRSEVVLPPIKRFLGTVARG